jgi:hypothetical protein
MSGQKFRSGSLDSGRKAEQVGIPVAANDAGGGLRDYGGDDLIDIGPELQSDD